MVRALHRSLAAGVLCAVMLPLAGAHAGEHRHRDHEDARRAVERGDALPLAEVLARVRGRLGGEVVGVSFEREGGRWIYEFRVVAPRGQLSEVHVDAKTAAVIEREID